MPQEDNTRQQELDLKRQYWKYSHHQLAGQPDEPERILPAAWLFHQFVYPRRKLAPKAQTRFPLIQVSHRDGRAGCRPRLDAAGASSRTGPGSLHRSFSRVRSVDAAAGGDRTAGDPMTVSSASARSSSRWAPPTCANPSTDCACWCRCTWRWSPSAGTCLPSATAAAT